MIRQAIAEGHIDSGRLRPETCHLSRRQLLLAEELILQGLDAKNHATVMGWQVEMASGLQRSGAASPGMAEKFLRTKLDLFLESADSAFPYLGLSAILRESDRDRKRILAASQKVKEVLEMNPEMSAKEFLASNI